MKRTVLEIILALAMAGAAAFGYMSWKQAQGSKAAVEELTKTSEEATAKIEEAEKSAKAASEEMEAMSKESEAAAAKAGQLDAVKAGLSSGTTLADLEAAYKKEKNLSPERLIGLATLRMLTKGAEDPGTVEAYKKALALSDWSNRKNTICAAQIGLAATGEKIEVMADCLPKGSPKMAEGHSKDDGHADMAKMMHMARLIPQPRTTATARKTRATLKRTNMLRPNLPKTVKKPLRNRLKSMRLCAGITRAIWVRRVGSKNFPPAAKAKNSRR
jgi:hypothetical protein